VGIYDFPQRDLKVRIMNGVLAPLLSVPWIRKAFTARIKEGMLQSYQRVLRAP
jgi:hypothetical protein